MTGEALIIGMDSSLRGHYILLYVIRGTKNTWCQVIRKKVMLDHKSLLPLLKDTKVKRDIGIT